MNEEIIRGSSVKVAFIVGSIEGLVFLHTMPTTYKFQKYCPLGAIAKQPLLDERKHIELICVDHNNVRKTFANIRKLSQYKAELLLLITCIQDTRYFIYQSRVPKVIQT